MLSCPSSETSASSALPTEFILRLGSQSTTHVVAMARILEELGAHVEVDDSGALVAVRPEA